MIKYKLNRFLSTLLMELPTYAELLANKTSEFGPALSKFFVDNFEVALDSIIRTDQIAADAIFKAYTKIAVEDFIIKDGTDYFRLLVEQADDLGYFITPYFDSAFKTAGYLISKVRGWVDVDGTPTVLKFTSESTQVTQEIIDSGSNLLEGGSTAELTIGEEITEIKALTTEKTIAPANPLTVVVPLVCLAIGIGVDFFEAINDKQKWRGIEFPEDQIDPDGNAIIQIDKDGRILLPQEMIETVYQYMTKELNVAIPRTGAFGWDTFDLYRAYLNGIANRVYTKLNPSDVVTVSKFFEFLDTYLPNVIQDHTTFTDWSLIHTAWDTLYGDTEIGAQHRKRLLTWLNKVYNPITHYLSVTGGVTPDGVSVLYWYIYHKGIIEKALQYTLGGTDGYARMYGNDGTAEGEYGWGQFPVLHSYAYPWPPGNTPTVGWITNQAASNPFNDYAIDTRTSFFPRFEVNLEKGGQKFKLIGDEIALCFRFWADAISFATNNWQAQYSNATDFNLADPELTTIYPSYDADPELVDEEGNPISGMDSVTSGPTTFIIPMIPSSWPSLNLFNSFTSIGVGLLNDTHSSEGTNPWYDDLPYQEGLPLVNPNTGTSSDSNTKVKPIGVIEQTPEGDEQTFPDTELKIETEPQPNPDVTPTPAPNPDPNPQPAPQPNPQPEPSPLPVPNPDPEPLPSVAVLGSNRLWSIYNPTEAQINQLGAWLWDSSILGQLRDLWTSPLQALISLKQVWAQPITGDIQNIYFGSLNSGVPSLTVSDRVRLYQLGEVLVPQYYFDYRDFAPYTKVSIYLPFIGTPELDPSEVIGSKLEVRYYFDMYTGTCVAQILVKRARDLEAAKTLYRFTGNAAVEIPLTDVDYSGQVQALVGLIGGAATASSALNMLEVQGGKSAFYPKTFANPEKAQMGIGGMVGSMMHKMVGFSRSGNFSSNAGMLQSKTPYIIVNRSIGVDPAAKGELTGYPTHKTMRLGNISGFARITAINLETAATQVEKDEIEMLLNQGVIF